MKPEAIDLGFKIKESDLYKLDLPVEEISISEIMHNADIAYLEKEGTDDWNLSPRELIKNWDREITHSARVKDVDLSYPIMIYYFKNKWIILDGVHRFTKAILDGNKTILVKKVSNDIIENLLGLKKS